MRYCLVPHACQAPTPCHQHLHVGTAERDDLLRHHAAEWLVHPDRKTHQHGVLRFLGQFAVRGFSARYGETLAMDRSSWWARLMVSEIKHVRMED